MRCAQASLSLTLRGNLSPADIARLEQLADAAAQAVTDLDSGSREAVPMLDVLAHDLANDRAIEWVWKDVERMLKG